ncbi:restriction modification system DNA specificity domain protein [Haladaptatus paucihalophilus DX253]|uniref:Restriction modification system DNA specificity domain protein n=1 Tax=Haladaptatus paucihalophilus DX253 TaxID=797209 RepID=E7QT49_HALPU|nr:restriction endonuclease subunit S [Haladaptatus paucihalophilus]EFW92330.1 restriction modification system DNA specificity domain protein [Haladaptatus paucihalophilus DX253]SHL60281.1 type I restriction enzyme, S subunit [Haladaptatus paucihalophilus DX253]
MSEAIEQSNRNEDDNVVRLGPRSIAIPEEWDAVPFEEAIELNPRYDKPDNGPFNYLPMDAVDEDKQTIEYWTEREKDDCTTTWFKNGDTVYAKITPCTENGKIAFINGLETEVGSGSTEFLVFHPRKGVTDEQFVYYLSNLPEFRSVTISLMEGSTGRQRVPSDVFKGGLQIPLPSLPEQRRIADILSTVDERIQQTDVIIEKTNELLSGVQKDLFTTGYSDDREVGTRRLIEAPLDWDIAPLSEFTTDSAYGPRFSSDEYDENGALATLRTTDLNDDGGINHETMPLADLDPSDFEDHLLKKGDFIISRTGAYCGICTIWDDYEIPTVPGAYMIRFRLDDGLNPLFLREYVNSSVGSKKVDVLARGSSQKNLAGSDLLSMPIPVPSRTEQDRIVEVIQAVKKRIQNEREYKQKLQDLKRGLMQDLLTGKVRVNTDN